MTKRPPLYNRVREILDSARVGVARSVNTTQVVANWLIGRELVEEEQAGQARASYGERLMDGLAKKLKKDYGSGYSAPNLRLMRQFYLGYTELITENQIRYAVSSKSGHDTKTVVSGIRYPVSSESWIPGKLHANLSWTHYRNLLRVEIPEARAFYEIEAIKNCWAARELERQINSLLFERLAKSRDKKGVLRLAKRGQEIMRPEDIFKEPVVIEFLGLPESEKLSESNIERALLNNLQAFLLEMGRGFALVSRQERITLDGDHFYIDLVFYHTVLKCYVLIDLKVGKLTHADLGQLQFYVNYFDRERRTKGDAKTLGLILCTDKNDAVVKYTYGRDQDRKIFASRYKLHLPSENELRKELRRELRVLGNR